ncbi:adenylyl-sulfate kinase [Streptomyces sp. NPDC090442]|uniref:adenylyl-sulfate kinase n=1 Tax=Streptomyces sp. NPDC090442 TaxID=3365962 RepID=UPI0037F3F25C
MTPRAFCTCRPGCPVWLTGLPSADKSTLAEALARQLRRQGRRVEVLDGDINRRLRTADLGFSRQDRIHDVQRIGLIAEVLARNGIAVLVPVIAPYAQSRDAVHARHRQSATAYLEVHVATPLEACSQRDVKGLYARQTAGALTGLTGVDDPYDLPDAPDLRIRADRDDIDTCTAALHTLLRERGLA